MYKSFIKASQKGYLPPVFTFLQKMEKSKGTLKISRLHENEMPIYGFYKSISKLISPIPTND